MKTLCSHHSSCFSDPFVYIYGGYDGKTIQTLSTVHKYNTLNSEWKILFGQDENYERCGHSAVIYNNRMIIFAGYSWVYHNDIITFDLETLKWDVISPKTKLLPPKRWCHTANLDPITRKMYIFGGFCETKQRKDTHSSLNDLFVFDFKTEEWTKLEPLGEIPKRNNHSSVLINENLYIFGGVEDKEKRNDLWCYNTLINTLKEMIGWGNVPPPIYGHSSWVKNDLLYIFGGSQGGGTYSDKLYMCNIKTCHWIFIKEYPEKQRRNHTSEAILTNRVFTYGGYNGKFLNDELIFHLPIPSKYILYPKYVKAFNCNFYFE